MMLFISFPAMTMMNSVSGHINVMHLIVFCGILNNKDDLAQEVMVSLWASEGG